MSYQNMLEKIVTRIWKERTKLGLGKEELALKADVSKGTIYKLERFHANPTLETLDKIAAALNLTIEDLCDSNK